MSDNQRIVITTHLPPSPSVFCLPVLLFLLVFFSAGWLKPSFCGAAEGLSLVRVKIEEIRQEINGIRAKAESVKLDVKIMLTMEELDSKAMEQQWQGSRDAENYGRIVEEFAYRQDKAKADWQYYKNAQGFSQEEIDNYELLYWQAELTLQQKELALVEARQIWMNRHAIPDLNFIWRNFTEKFWEDLGAVLVDVAEDIPNKLFELAVDLIQSMGEKLAKREPLTPGDIQDLVRGKLGWYAQLKTAYQSAAKQAFLRDLAAKGDVPPKIAAYWFDAIVMGVGTSIQSAVASGKGAEISSSMDEFIEKKVLDLAKGLTGDVAKLEMEKVAKEKAKEMGQEWVQKEMRRVAREITERGTPDDLREALQQLMEDARKGEWIRGEGRDAVEKEFKETAARDFGKKLEYLGNAVDAVAEFAAWQNGVALWEEMEGNELAKWEKIKEYVQTEYPESQSNLANWLLNHESLLVKLLTGYPESLNTFGRFTLKGIILHDDKAAEQGAKVSASADGDEYVANILTSANGKFEFTLNNVTRGGTVRVAAFSADFQRRAVGSVQAKTGVAEISLTLAGIDGDVNAQERLLGHDLLMKKEPEPPVPPPASASSQAREQYKKQLDAFNTQLAPINKSNAELFDNANRRANAFREKFTGFASSGTGDCGARLISRLRYPSIYDDATLYFQDLFKKIEPQRVLSLLQLDANAATSLAGREDGITRSVENNRKIIRELTDLLQNNEKEHATAEETSTSLLEDLAGITDLARRITPVSSSDKHKIQELLAFTVENMTKLEEWREKVLPGFAPCADLLKRHIDHEALLTTEFQILAKDWRTGADALRIVAVRTGAFAGAHQQWQKGMDGYATLDSYLAGLKTLSDQMDGLQQAFNQAAGICLDSTKFISEADRKEWIVLLVQGTHGASAFLRRMDDMIRAQPAYYANEARGELFYLLRVKYGDTAATRPKPADFKALKPFFGSPVKAQLFDTSLRRLTSPPTEVVNTSPADRNAYFEAKSKELAALLREGKNDLQQARSLYQGLSAGVEASAVTLVSLMPAELYYGLPGYGYRKGLQERVKKIYEDYRQIQPHIPELEQAIAEVEPRFNDFVGRIKSSRIEMAAAIRQFEPLFQDVMAAINRNDYQLLRRYFGSGNDIVTDYRNFYRWRGGLYADPGLHAQVVRITDLAAPILDFAKKNTSYQEVGMENLKIGGRSALGSDEPLVFSTGDLQDGKLVIEGTATAEYLAALEISLDAGETFAIIDTSGTEVNRTGQRQRHPFRYEIAPKGGQEMNIVFLYKRVFRDLRHQVRRPVIIHGAVGDASTSGDFPAIKKMYEEFARAYESRDVGSVTRFLAEDWEADDGTFIDDMEDILQNSFDVFDRVTMKIDGLSISALPDGRFLASYRTRLSGQIFNNDLHHEEEAEIRDTLILTSGGPRIFRTGGGRFWLQ